MTATAVFISMFAGEDKKFDITVKDAADAVVDISGQTAITWKLSVDELTAASVSKTFGSGIAYITDGTDGGLRVSIDLADTSSLASRTYYHECVVTLAAGAAHVVTGTLWLRPAIP